MAAKNCGNPVTFVVPVKWVFRHVSTGIRRYSTPLRADFFALFSLFLLSCTHKEKLDLTRLTVPPGFHIAVFAEAPHARQMAFSPSGFLLVTETSDGTVVALPDPKHTGHAERNVPILSGLNAPHGIAFHQGK